MIIALTKEKKISVLNLSKTILQSNECTIRDTAKLPFLAVEIDSV